MRKLYRSKSVIKEAIQYDGENIQEILSFMGVNETGQDLVICVETLENAGKQEIAVPGDFILKGTKGEFHSCKPDVFEKCYEEIKMSKVPNIYLDEGD